MYVLFEGIDTCGKSTQIELVAQKYPEIIITHEPGGTPFGKQAREILLTNALASKRAELLLFLADRAEHYQEVIKPNQDKLILSDRGFISGLGYALANGDFDFDELVHLNRFALEGHFPDKIILFLTDMPTLTYRTSQKSLDGIERRGLEYLLEVQEHMKQSILKLGIPHLFVDATDEIQNIHDTILEYLKL
ncbi:MAG TPA: dTMP kinase [Sulfurovum sp.]|nr:MAG: dTMP kinase [Sulfurovum sp. 35-42-20]OYY54711.1 MAG: dTMP kinase [Sulfurovum sp. 28-43-6]OYZ25072.1 MAG: dTMP kinase [Sulfurovum sp. 16-42-52]OYZ48980.1 MAG: dTMP kinase [Sulfurovum sp. 24-42-9]OZA43089.1 MAG: dTMP kinase [Sulfurovum sp. 17-42-90]OZA61119.1 MAG: dTMP kinase [Sulfurovum sp. 39-42-12]HQR73611.1 dTMP kinase [Sulfurovum sp.]